MQLKGKLIIIGGGEDKGESSQSDFTKDGILSRIVAESRKKTKSVIEIITTASGVPEESGNDYLKAFHKLEAENVNVFSIHDRSQADEPKNLKRLEAADIVFVTGGDQLRLTSILGGTKFFEVLVSKLEHDKDFIYAGTSAGAAAASENMLFEGTSEQALLKGEVKSTAGFGLVNDIVFDTHFIRRGRIGRLFQILVSNPKLLGVGLAENTGLLIANGKMEAIGPGMAILVDAANVKQTNLLDVRDGAPLSIENLILHVISKYDVYDLEKKELRINTPEELRQ